VTFEEPEPSGWNEPTARHAMMLFKPAQEHAEAVDTGGALLDDVDRMPSLAMLYDRLEQSYDHLLTASSRHATGIRIERRIWTGLVVLALVWGCVTGLSFTVPDFAVDPLTATFGCLATLVLVGTVWTHVRSRR
jgi:hypothetical protein